MAKDTSLSKKLLLSPFSVFSSILYILTKLRKEVSRALAQLDDLMKCVSDLQDDMARLSDDVQKVIGMLNKPNPDMQAAIDALKKVDTGLDAAAQSMEDAVTPPPPVP